MRTSRRSAPGPLRTRPGALVFLLVCLAGCDAPDRGDTVRLGDDTARLARGARLPEVRLSGAGPDELTPDTLRARSGGAVRFVAADARTHAVVFDEAQLAPAARAYLERTQQLRGPPLIQPGATWVISLEAAPRGSYPFVCLTHGGRGVLIVQD